MQIIEKCQFIHRCSGLFNDCSRNYLDSEKKISSSFYINVYLQICSKTALTVNCVVALNP